MRTRIRKTWFWLSRNKSAWLPATIAVTVVIAIIIGAVSIARHDDAIYSRTHEISGTIRSVWIDADQERLQTVISIAPDVNPQNLVTIEFNRLEPSLWKGMHAKIAYHETISDGLHSPPREIYQLIKTTQLP